MAGLRAVLAAGAGALLYYLAVVCFGGWLAAMVVPKAYFAFFGRERVELALGVLNVLSWALPVAAAVALGALVALRAWHTNLRSCSWALGLGMLADFLYWHASSASIMASRPDATLSFGLAFTSTLLPEWREAPNAFAPWLGLALAIWWAARRWHGRLGA